ncbi:MAG: beta-phosphoglucomutase family hydrolase [Rhodospirillales bacterium]|nr:beta-phosphoglucomutase family hydrolase [Rhodospirillales bacterium]
MEGQTLHLGAVGDLAAVVFDLDGVITRTAGIHYAAWKALFDDFLARRAGGGAFAPFRPNDYARFVDGRPRYEGVRTFLASRGIELPDGDPADPPGDDTVCALGNRKNVMFREALGRLGAEVYPGSRRLLEAMRPAGLRAALVTSSKNGRDVLKAAGLSDAFDAVIDGNDALRHGLRGKPHPDTFVHAAGLMGLPPGRCVVIEDAVAGVQAGRAGAFRLVIGVDRGAGRRSLAEAGADVVVNDLGEIDV